MEANKVASAQTTKIIHNDYSDVFTGIGCLKGTFSLQNRNDAKPYEVLPRCVAYAIQKGTRKITNTTNIGPTWCR